MIIESSLSAKENADGATRFDKTASGNTGFPLSTPQLGIWFAQWLNPSAAYNIGEYIEIRGAINPALFERALRQVVAESEALRIRLTEHDGEFPGSPREHDSEFESWDLNWRHYFLEKSPIQPYGLLGIGIGAQRKNKLRLVVGFPER